MEYLGVVLELRDNKAYLITDSCEVYCIKKQPGMYEGMEINFDSSEVINNINSAAKYSAVVASIAAVFVAIMFYVNILYSNQIYAYVNVDINTNWELVVDKKNRVIDVNVKDNNSSFIVEDIDYKSKPLESVLVDLVEKLNQNGMIDLNSDNKALITACLNDKDGKQVDKNGLRNLELSYNKIKGELSSRNIDSYFLEVKSEDRKLAADNNISTGRYSIYKISKEQGIDIDLENLKNKCINEIMEKVVIGNNLIEDNNNSDKGVQNSPVKDNIDKDNGEPFIGDNFDLSLGGVNDIDIIQSIEAANIETQKEIQKIQQQVNTDIANETNRANKEIATIKMDPNISNDEKNKKIKQIESELINKINEIKRIGNEKAQAELTKLEKKVKDLLPQIN